MVNITAVVLGVSLMCLGAYVLGRIHEPERSALTWEQLQRRLRYTIVHMCLEAEVDTVRLQLKEYLNHLEEGQVFRQAVEDNKVWRDHANV